MGRFCFLSAVYPRLLQFGPFTLPTYGAFLAIGLVAALFLALRTARLLRINPESMWNLSMLAVFSALLGAKLLLIGANLRDFFRYPMLMLSISAMNSGNAVLVGFLLALTSGLIYIRIKKMPLLRTLDAAAPALALADTIACVGAFLAGAGYGKPTMLPWGVVYRDRWSAFWYGTPLGIRLQPVQLYEAAIIGALCLFLLWLLPRQHQNGEGIGAGLFLSGLATFGLEFLRGDTGRHFIFDGAFPISQGIAFLMVIAGALFWLERRAPGTGGLNAN